MQLEENLSVKNFGRHIGFSLALFVFFSMFYTVLRLLNKLPAIIEYWHVIVLMIIIIIIRLVYFKVK